MVLMSWNNIGEIPFHEVFIHPKILDGNGETMSKSKGNGVDPLDVINKFGPDALRFGLARLCTDTQDVRMPVQYECPHCEKLIEQTKKNRSLPRIDCPSCSKPFSTQWAESDEDKALERAPVVSERFETARNFMNKLWNAARFTLMNLDGYEAGVIDVADLPLEDRWLLSRLSTVTAEVTSRIDAYRFAEASDILYKFAWDEFCSFYVEIAKPRLNDDAKRKTVKRVLAHGLDTLLRLLHPIMPFVTESIWEHLNEIAPERGLNPEAASPFLMRASWPESNRNHYDESIETQFAEFQEVVSAVRSIRASQNIAPRETVPVRVRCDSAVEQRLSAMSDYLEGLAGADVQGIGPEMEPFEIDAPLSIPSSNIDIHVNLEAFIDFEAERARLEKLLAQKQKQAQGKENKLANENFVARAPEQVVADERAALEELREQITAILADIERLAQRAG